MNRESAKELKPELREALHPLLAEIESLNARITEYDTRIEQLAKEVYPEVARLKQVKGVGPLIALTYVLTLDDPHRFAAAGMWGALWGCAPGAGTRGGVNHNCTSAKKETVISECCWYRERTTSWGPLDKIVI